MKKMKKNRAVPKAGKAKNSHKSERRQTSADSFRSRSTVGSVKKGLGDFFS